MLTRFSWQLHLLRTKYLAGGALYPVGEPADLFRHIERRAWSATGQSTSLSSLSSCACAECRAAIPGRFLKRSASKRCDSAISRARVAVVV